MEQNFEEFLEDIEHFDVDQPDLPEDFSTTGNNIVNEDERNSVSRFRSLNNSPPSLTSSCILRASSWMNEMTCNPANNQQVHDTFHHRVKLLPQDIQARIRSQLSLTTLRCIYQYRVWELDPRILASGIKQEEDMLRYLFWKQPNNPLLKHFGKTLVIKLFEDKKYFDLLRSAKLPPTETLKQSLVQAYQTTCFDYKFVERAEFMNNFDKFTNGCLKNLNWNNVLVVGGSVLKSLRQKSPPATNERYETDSASDIDIYLYGLTTEQAQAKVEEIFDSIQSCWREKIGIFKTEHTITLVSDGMFKNTQIILSTYTSPLEILLTSDMNSCSIGFNGTSVLVTPRFLFGSMYGTNILDSSLKFGTKLRLERIRKYYYRGYNFAAPLFVRVHGHGSFNTNERIKRNVHPTTRQMVELMSLTKVALLRMIEPNRQFYEFDQELRDDWSTGFSISYRISTRRDEYDMLTTLVPQPPSWVQNQYKNAQSLRWVHTFLRPPPRYSEEIRTIYDMNWSNHPEQNFDPNKTSDIRKYVQEHCKFDNYHEGSLQCFHLNLFVNKAQTVLNPYREMNTSLVDVHCRLETTKLKFTHFNSFLQGSPPSLTAKFKMHGVNWSLNLTRGKAATFIALTKEEDEEENDSLNDTNYRPTKFFANFFVKINNQKKLTAGEPKNLIFDGSQVFTYNRPDNMWLTWVRNGYFKGAFPSYDHNGDSVTEINHDVQYMDKHGNTFWEITMQLLVPQFNVMSLRVQRIGPRPSWI